MGDQLTKEGLVSLIFVILAVVFLTWGINWQTAVGLFCLVMLVRG